MSRKLVEYAVTLIKTYLFSIEGKVSEEHAKQRVLDMIENGTVDLENRIPIRVHEHEEITSIEEHN